MKLLIVTNSSKLSISDLMQKSDEDVEDVEDEDFERSKHGT